MSVTFLCTLCQAVFFTLCLANVNENNFNSVFKNGETVGERIKASEIFNRQYSQTYRDASSEELQQSLANLGIDGVESSQPSRKLMVAVYQRLVNMREADDNEDTDTVRPVVGRAGSVNAITRHARFHFSLNGLAKREIPVKVELLVKSGDFFKHQNNAVDRKLKLTVTVNQSGKVTKTVAVQSTLQRSTMDGFHQIDLTKTFKKIKKSVGRLKNESRITVSFRCRRNNLFKTKKIDRKKQSMILVVYSRDRRFFKKFNSKVQASAKYDDHERSKRSSISAMNFCRKRAFYVDFDLIGWSQWIVYPKRYNAFTCAGTCPEPLDWYFSPTNHGRMQSLMRFMGGADVSKACCVPVKLSPITVLYYEKNELVVRLHHDMRVDSCGCR